MLGTTLDHYRIERRLGAGGMGEVYLARDLRLDRDVAIKVLGDVTDPAAEDRLLQEAKAASALNHPGICTVHEVGRAGGVSYIVMEHIDGTTLAEMIPPGGLASDRIHDIALQILAALAHAHGRGIVHRDLKSGNVMITRDGRVKLLDFGLACRLSRDDELTTRTLTLAPDEGLIAGTLSSMSPEVLSGQPADTRSDVWAMGVLLHEMTAGTYPFTGATTFEITAAILREPPPPIPGRLSRSLQRVIRRCLTKEPWKRYRDASELLVALETLSEAVPPESSGNLVSDSNEPADAAIRSLVVLPLANLSGDREQEYFADGLTEAITSALAKVPGLRIISRTSAMQYKGVARPLPEIARELHVDGVVEGSVLRFGDRVRISAQLIRARSDEHLWAETYDRDLRDVLGLLTDISRAVAGEIAGQVSEEGRPARRVDPAAYEAYLKGRFSWNIRTDAALRKGIEFFQRAIERDPSYALAYSGMADCYDVLGFQGSEPPGTAFPRAKAAATQALAIDARLAEAHVSLAYAELHHRWNWREAGTAFARGMELNPNYATGYHWYALYFTGLGRKREAKEMMARARELDPLALIIGTATAWMLAHFREFDASIEASRRTLEIHADFWWGRVWMANTFVRKGMLDEAIEEFERALDPLRRHPGLLASLASARAKAGDRDAARELLAEMADVAARQYVRPYEFAKTHLALDDHDAALGWLEKAHVEGGNWLNYLAVDPEWDPLRSDARFEDLLGRVYGVDPPRVENLLQG